MSVWLCVSSCFAVSSWKLTWEKVTGPRGLWAYFQSDPTRGQRSSRQGSKYFFSYGGFFWRKKAPVSQFTGAIWGFTPGGHSTLFFGECVPCGFQNVGSREQIFLKKWGYWERKWSCVAWWDVFALQTPKLMICPPFLLKTNISWKL